MVFQHGIGHRCSIELEAGRKKGFSRAACGRRVDTGKEPPGLAILTIDCYQPRSFRVTSATLLPKARAMTRSSGAGTRSLPGPATVVAP